MYSQRIERLREHLENLQLISSRREGLEERVRKQLQREIRELRGGTEGGEGDEKYEVAGGGTNWESEVAVLQADLAKVLCVVCARKPILSVFLSVSVCVQ